MAQEKLLCFWHAQKNLLMWHAMHITSTHHASVSLQIHVLSIYLSELRKKKKTDETCVPSMRISQTTATHGRPCIWNARAIF